MEKHLKSGKKTATSYIAVLCHFMSTGKSITEEYCFQEIS